MAKPKTVKLLNQKFAIKLLKQHGYKQTSGGKHQVKMVKGGTAITLPQFKGEDYSKSFTRTILKQAGLESLLR